MYQGIWRVSPEFRRNRPKKDGIIGNRTEEPDIRRNHVTRSETVWNWTESSASSRYHRDILWIHSDGAHFVLRKLENHLLYVEILYNEISSIIIFFECLKAPFIEAFVHYYNFFSIKVIKVFRLKCILTYKRAFPRLINFTSQIISHGIFPSL